jgi:choline dehydrogenase-like flavoprotein
MLNNIVVIGGGLAGSLICNALVEHAGVTLLEIGGKDSIQYPPVGFDRKKLAEVATFCFGGGGTTNLWHNGLIPLTTGDISGREFVEVLTDAAAFADDAAAKLFFTSGPFSTAYEQLVAEMTDNARKVGRFPDGIDCLMYPKKFRKLTIDPKVDDYYTVDRIGFIFEGSRIRTVTFSIASREYAVDADAVIVAAGALGSPGVLKEIMRASGHRGAEPGNGFIDHPMGFVGKVRFRKDVAGIVRQLSMSDRGDYVSRSAIRLKSSCGQYTCCAFFRPALTMDNRLAVYKYKSLLGASTGMARVRNAFSRNIVHPDIVAEIFSHLFGINIPSRTYNVLFIAEQKRGNNRVYQDGSGLRVDWSISGEELAVYRELLEKLEGMLRDAAEEINIETRITEEWLWSAAHHSCTISLGGAPRDLVDSDLKLKCCDNAFVCDGSVIQEHSYANTGLTIGQLAMRLARRVLDVPAP